MYRTMGRDDWLRYLHLRPEEAPRALILEGTIMYPDWEARMRARLDGAPHLLPYSESRWELAISRLTSGTDLADVYTISHIGYRIRQSPEGAGPGTQTSTGDSHVKP
jgi:hypothetical protein